MNKKSSILLGLKLAFLGVSIWYVVYEVSLRGGRLDNFVLPKNFWQFTLLCTLLMFVNWGLEALRWRVSLKTVEQLSFWQSCKVVLTGLAMNLLVPFTVGDAVARILSLKNKHQGTCAMMLNRGIMLVITLSYGLYSVDSYVGKDWSLVHLAWVLPFGLTPLFFLRKHLTKFALYFRELSLRLTLSIVSLSLLRYLVFVFQFFILIKLFLPEVHGETILQGIGWVFLSRSIFPAFLGGMGIREASGLMFFSNFVPNPTVVLGPIFIVWVINTMLPSLLGLISVWNFRFKIAGWSFLSQG